MQSVALTRVLRNQTHLIGAEKRDEARYDAFIAFGGGGGLCFVLLGFFLLIVFSISGGGNSSLNYAGVASLIAGFVFFGFAAHFMDRRDAAERQSKRARLAVLTGKNFR